MSGKKRIELRSNGQPRACPEPVEGAAVPTFFIFMAAVVVICGGVMEGARAQSSAASAAANSAGPKTAGQQFKNIKVLKDIPADQLIPAMQFITASLGVECEFCHVQDAFDKDDKKTKVDCAQNDGDDVHDQQE